jgi:hypothetical protein
MSMSADERYVVSVHDKPNKFVVYSLADGAKLAEVAVEVPLVMAVFDPSDSERW